MIMLKQAFHKVNMLIRACFIAMRDIRLRINNNILAQPYTIDV